MEEFDELKSFWEEKNKALEHKISVNEELLTRLNMDKAISEFDKLLKLSIVGRYSALVFFIASFVFASFVFYDFEYSIPQFIGGIAMLWSFIFHSRLPKAKYENISIIKMLEKVNTFHKYTFDTAKYDIGVTMFGFLVFLPVYLKLIFKMSVYTSLRHFLIFIGLYALFSIYMYIGCKGMYKGYDEKLTRISNNLKEITTLENK